jgi:hypothetical protein
LGLSVWLERNSEYSPFDEELISRLRLAFDIANYYSDYFSPISIEIWENATVQSLHGRMIRVLKAEKGLNTDLRDIVNYIREYSFRVKSKIIVRVLGNWVVANSPVVLGYVSVSNREMRPVYGDVSMNAFSKGDIDDVVDLFLKAGSATEFLIDSFAAKFGHYEDEVFKVKSLYFHEGAPSRSDITTLVAAHYGNINTFLLDSLYTAILQEPTIGDSLSAYRYKFLVNTIHDVPDFPDFLATLFHKYGVLYNRHGSVILSTRERNSFAKLFGELSKQVLQPMAMELPKKVELASKVRHAIEGKGSGQSKIA